MKRLIPLALLAALPLSACASTEAKRSSGTAEDPTKGATAPAKVRYLEENLDAWVTRWRMIERAERSIDLTTFILEEDTFGQALLGLLTEKAEQGVRVRVLFDARGTKPIDQLRYAGQNLGLRIGVGKHVNVRVYNPIVFKVAQALLKVSPEPISSSNHDKILIVDGEEAVIGGRNVATEYMASKEGLPHAYIDADIHVSGRLAVADLVKAFEREHQSRSSVPVLVRPSRLRDQNRTIPLARAAAMRAHLAGTDADCSQIGTWCDRLAQHQALRGRLADDEAEAAAAEVEILDTVAAESGSRVSISDRLVELLATAEEEVVVMNPYIVLTERGLNVLKDLSARGVRVRLLTNGPESGDSLVTQALFHETWPELMAQAPTLEITVVNENRLMHAKAAVIDQKVALVGSHNLDYLSSDVNGEVGAVVRSPAIAGAVRRHIVSWIDGERGNVVHYTIKRDASGRVLRETDGPLQGRVVVDVGVASHTAPEMVQKIGAMQVVLRARKLLPRYQKLL